jgi:hydrogenase small subunit
MLAITRRDFLKAGSRLALIMGLGTAATPKIAEALEQLASDAPPVLWLQGQSCSGCSVSLLNTEHPGPVQLLTRYIALEAHQTLSAATGETFMAVVNKRIEKGGFLLVVEGSIPAGMPHACRVGHEYFTDQVKRAAEKADAVIAVGTCAAFGGIPAAENNPTGAVSVADFLIQSGIKQSVVRIPGCPAHPDWTVGTLVHLLKFGLPPLDSKGRPRMFFSRLIHDQCPRFADYEREQFAKHFTDKGCLFKLGCLGPVTHADCTLRLWNSGANMCINANAPCVGCAREAFARENSFAFYPALNPETDGGERS